MATGPVSPEVPNPAITNDLYNRQMTVLLNQLAEAKRSGDTAQVASINKAIAAVEATYKTPDQIATGGTKPAPVPEISTSSDIKYNYNTQIQTLIKEREAAYNSGDIDKVKNIDRAIAAVAQSTTVKNADGTFTYTNPQTGEVIIYDTNGKVLSDITIPKADDTNAIDITGTSPEQKARAAAEAIAREQKVAFATGAKDWRFKMKLAPGSDYLYNANPPGILAPLVDANGVIFPYTPQISITYNANYSPIDLTHTNYKIFNYRGSSVENITIAADFTAQDMIEANYVLAVIHFFKSVTKMFYGQDNNPSRGVPPPLVYLQGFGQYQFDNHPVVITSFTYTFPTDVDYVNAYPTNNSLALGGVNLTPYQQNATTRESRIRTMVGIEPGGNPTPPVFTFNQNVNESTRIPSKITIQLQCQPIITRDTMSNQFSLQEYATGQLMRGTVNWNRTGGGVW